MLYYTFVKNLCFYFHVLDEKIEAFEKDLNFKIALRQCLSHFRRGQFGSAFIYCHVGYQILKVYLCTSIVHDLTEIPNPASTHLAFLSPDRKVEGI